MAYLVDAYNVIHADEEMARHLATGPLEKAREELISLLVRYRALTGTAITVVFDGNKIMAVSRESRGGVDVVFSRPPRNADQEIARILGKISSPKQTRVVSNDHEVQANARARGAKAVPSLVFLNEVRKSLERRRGQKAHLEPEEKYGRKPSRQEIEQLSAEFNRKLKNAGLDE